jgi:hypothetical protein
MSARRRDSLSPRGVNGGSDGQSVFDQDGGPAGSSKVPTATQTPVSFSLEAIDDESALSGEETPQAETINPAQPIRKGT